MIAWILLAAIIVGGLLLLFGLLKTLPAGQTRKTPRMMVGAGVVALTTGLAGVQQTSCPDPSPPDPAPAPDPVPPGPPFEQQVMALFDGTEAEAQTLAACAMQMGESIAWDGQRTKPSIATTTDLGRVWADMQRYRGLSESPWGDRFAALKSFLAGELKTRGIVDPAVSLPVDAARRGLAAQFYRELGMSLAKKSLAMAHQISANNYRKTPNHPCDR